MDLHGAIKKADEISLCSYCRYWAEVFRGLRLEAEAGLQLNGAH